MEILQQLNVLYCCNSTCFTISIHSFTFADGICVGHVPASENHSVAYNQMVPTEPSSSWHVRHCRRRVMSMWEFTGCSRSVPVKDRLVGSNSLAPHSIVCKACTPPHCSWAQVNHWERALGTGFGNVHCVLKDRTNRSSDVLGTICTTKLRWSLWLGNALHTPSRLNWGALYTLWCRWA